MSAWINSSQVSVTTGATTVTVSDGVSMESVISGDALMIAGQLPARCLSGTAPAGGVSTITLAAPWDGPNITNAKAVVMPSAALLRQVATEVAQQNASYSSWWSVMEEWQYAMGTVTVDGPAGPREIPTYPQLAADTHDFLSSISEYSAALLGKETRDEARLWLGLDLTFSQRFKDVRCEQQGGIDNLAFKVGTDPFTQREMIGHYYDGQDCAVVRVPGTGPNPRTALKLRAGEDLYFAIDYNAAWHRVYHAGNVDGSLWVTPTLLNGWSSDPADPVRCRVVMGMLQVKGRIQFGTNANGTIIFVLPVGFRPSSLTTAPLFSGASGSDHGANIAIYPGGNVEIYNVNNAHKSYVSFMHLIPLS